MAKNNKPEDNTITVDNLTGEPILLADVGGEIVQRSNITTSLTSLSIENYERLKAAAASIDPNSTAITVTAIYKEFAVNESVVGVFTGLDGITPRQVDELTGEMVKRFCKSVQWLGSDGKLYQCAGVALVGQFVDTETGEFKIPIGSKVKIVHTGKNNRTKLYEVSLFVD